MEEQEGAMSVNENIQLRKIDLTKVRDIKPQAELIEAYTRKTLLGTMILDGNTEETRPSRPRLAGWKTD